MGTRGEGKGNTQTTLLNLSLPVFFTSPESILTLTMPFLVLIMIMIWKTNIILVMLFVLVIGSTELLYLSSVLYKFNEGGYLPLVFALVLMFIMFVWNHVYRKEVLLRVRAQGFS